MKLPDELLYLLKQPSPAYVTTLMPDGSPQVTQTWIDTDGTHVVVNTPSGSQKVRNLTRDDRVAVAVSDPDNPSRYFAVRGRAVLLTEDGGAEHIEELSQRYIGAPYPWFGGPGQARTKVFIDAERVHGQG